VQRRSKAAADEFRVAVGADHGETVVASLDDPDAMALSSGVIVVTPSLVRALDADQRHAVLAHERAHVLHGHHRIRDAAALLAAANPLLRRVPDAIGYLTERWADEAAARATSRRTTASALQEVARLRDDRGPLSRATLHSAAVGVRDRILALEHGSERLRWSRLLLSLALVAGAVAVALSATDRTLDLFELARTLP
jgi:Zn-dependent protease with chaperone function